MDISSITATVLFLVAGDGRLLTDGFVAVKSVAVPSQEHAARWREIDEAEWVEPDKEDGVIDISSQLTQVASLILSKAETYGATEAIMQLDDFNIPAVEQLIEQFQVTQEDRSDISYVVNFVVLDIMGKLDQTWYRIWNERVKLALNEMFKQRRGAQAEDDMQDEPMTEPCESCRV